MKSITTDTRSIFPIWKQPRKNGQLMNLGIHLNWLQFVTNWLFDISAPKTAERGESDNIRTRVRQARDLPAQRAIPTDARNKPRFYQRNCRAFLGSSERKEMKLFDKEHDELIKCFERTHKGIMTQKEEKDFWSRGYIYTHGETNDLFLAFREGYAYGKLYERMNGD